MSLFGLHRFKFDRHVDLFQIEPRGSWIARPLLAVPLADHA